MVVIPNPTGLKTQPITTLGTKQLLFLQVDMQTDIATDYLNHDSLYNRAIRGMQTACEVSGVGIPKGEFKVIFFLIANKNSKKVLNLVKWYLRANHLFEKK